MSAFLFTLCIMAELKKSDLVNTYNSRNNSDFVGKYSTRKERFLEKAYNREPFELVSGDQVFVNLPESKFFLQSIENLKNVNDTLSGKALVVYSQKGIDLTKDQLDSERIEYTSIPLSKFKKTSEFGSSSETVAGPTEEVESLVAIFLAAGLQGRSGKVPTILDLPHDDQYYRTLDLDTPVSQVLQHFDSLSGDLEKADKVERWVEGSRVTAQKIIEYLGEKRNYIVYRNPPQIYEIFKKLNKRYGDRNKWNPADLWVIDSQQFQVTVDKHKSEEEQWKEFNYILRKAFNDKVAVGISLKSLYNLDSPKLEEFNNYEEGQWKSTAEGLIRVEDCIEPNFEFQITGLGSCKFLWERKQGKRDSLSFRLANMEGFSSFNVEYQPSDSKGRGGKAGIPAINYEFRRLGCSTLEGNLGRKSTIAQQFIRKQGEDYTRYVYLLQKYRKGLSGGTVESYLSQSPSRMLSKYLSLICYDNFMKMEKESRYQFLTGVLEYAISTTEDSAPFIKVY